MDTGKYWTGIADVTSDEMPSNISGALYRILTFAENYEAFMEKVTYVLKNSGDILFTVEEPETLSEFLKHSWLTEDHEIYDIMPTAEKNQDDVVCGEIQYYSAEEN